jgi:hypothetical protein
VTTSPRGRDAHLGVRELGIAGIALLVGALILAPGGASGTVRTILGFLAVLVVPGWLVGRLADEEGDAIARLVGGTVATVAICAVCGFVGFELGLRVATAVIAVPLLVLVVAAALLGMTGPAAPRAPLGPLVAALGLGAVALLGALGTHLVLPAVPVEPAFSIEAAHAVASPSGVTVTVTVARVHTEEPTQLQLFIGVHLAATTLIPSDQTAVTLHARLPAGSPRCPASVRLEAPNHAFLTPPVTCVGR